MNPAFAIELKKLDMINGYKLKALSPDAAGFYKVPLFVMDTTSRNKAYYDPRSVVAAHNNPNMKFYKSLTEGNLEGEIQHPFDESIKRMVKIDRTKTSHVISAITAELSPDGKATILYGMVRPAGPYKQTLTESFADSHINTAFSIRSLVSIIKKVADVVHKRMLAVITYDNCDGPGFEVASKRYAPNNISTETISYDIDISDADIYDGIAVESIENESIMDLFGTDQISIISKEVGIIDPHTGNVVRDGESQSVFHNCFQHSV